MITGNNVSFGNKKTKILIWITQQSETTQLQEVYDILEGVGAYLKVVVTKLKHNEPWSYFTYTIPTNKKTLGEKLRITLERIVTIRQVLLLHDKTLG